MKVWKKASSQKHVKILQPWRKTTKKLVWIRRRVKERVVMGRVGKVNREGVRRREDWARPRRVRAAARARGSYAAAHGRSP